MANGVLVCAALTTRLLLPTLDLCFCTSITASSELGGLRRAFAALGEARLHFHADEFVDQVAASSQFTENKESKERPKSETSVLIDNIWTYRL